MTSKDTFIMYTHSHGVPRGLLIDTEASKRMNMVYRWDEFVETILSLPAKNVIIFTMACHSGYLAEAMKANSEKWQGQWVSQQRNLLVFTLN